jgi:peptide-methionine (S)-S-oxide reductase
MQDQLVILNMGIRHMRVRIVIGILFTMLLGVCGSSRILSYGKASLEDQQDSSMNNKPELKLATFGSGCFWCTEAIFKRLKGVVKVVAGYSGGHVDNPTYEQVCSGTTGHAESIQITYDSTEISYPALLEVFWRTHDPTTKDRQGYDIGTQYRSVIFYHDAEQKKLAESYKNKLGSEGIWDKPIVTEIVPFTKFWPAEDYHQDYFDKNPDKSYCRLVITPKIKKFREIFKDRLKTQK